VPVVIGGWGGGGEGGPKSVEVTAAVEVTQNLQMLQWKEEAVILGPDIPVATLQLVEATRTSERRFDGNVQRSACVA